MAMFNAASIVSHRGDRAKSCMYGRLGWGLLSGAVVSATSATA